MLSAPNSPKIPIDTKKGRNTSVSRPVVIVDFTITIYCEPARLGNLAYRGVSVIMDFTIIPIHLIRRDSQSTISPVHRQKALLSRDQGTARARYAL